MSKPRKDPRQYAPCPFCKSIYAGGFVGVPPLKDPDGNWTGRRAVHCPECEAHGPVRLTDDEAVEAWNQCHRAAQADQV